MTGPPTLDELAGIAHPGADEVIAVQGKDAAAIIQRCIGDVPGGKKIFYQKHMTLHLLPELDRSWLSSLVNCFLIREPEAVIASYTAVRSDATLRTAYCALRKTSISWM